MTTFLIVLCYFFIYLLVATSIAILVGKFLGRKSKINQKVPDGFGEADWRRNLNSMTAGKDRHFLGKKLK